MKQKVGIGIDIGGTAIKYGLVTNKGEILWSSEKPTEGCSSADVVLDNVIEAVKEVQEKAKTLNKQPITIGIGTPGLVKDANTIVGGANNISGWQWVSGSGADAAPYFRIFNPILQSERFDKKGNYIKKWVPELSSVPEEFIHKPWEINEEIDGFKIGKDYPMPIVDHPKAREAALNAFKKIKK